MAWLSLLIPALLLVGSSNCFACSPGFGAGERLVSVLHAGSNDAQGTTTGDNFLEQAARPWSRRANVQRDADGLLAPVALAQSHVTLPDRTVEADLPRASLPLAQSWQFIWRTASEPRAPSSVS